jgi:hypothetical protein
MGERIRDKIAVSKYKGMWMVAFRHDLEGRGLVINPEEADRVRASFKDIYGRDVSRLQVYLEDEAIRASEGPARSAAVLGARPGRLRLNSIPAARPFCRPVAGCDTDANCGLATPQHPAPDIVALTSTPSGG